MTPVSSANDMPARSLEDAVRARRHGRWTTSRPANSSATPAQAPGLSRSPSTVTATMTANSGALPRASGYTIERSPRR